MGSQSSRSSTGTSPSIWRRSQPTRTAWWSFATRCEDITPSHGTPPNKPLQTAVGDPNQVVSASVSPRCVWSLTQATHPSGRIKTAVSAVTAPSAGSSHAPTYLVKGSCRQSASVAFRIGDLDVLNHLAGSTERLTLTRCRGRLYRVEHAMPRDGFIERGAEMRLLAIVAREMRVRLGDVGTGALWLRPPILLRHRQDLERGLRTVATA